MERISRRDFLRGAALTAAASVITGCDVVGGARGENLPAKPTSTPVRTATPNAEATANAQVLASVADALKETNDRLAALEAKATAASQPETRVGVRAAGGSGDVAEPTPTPTRTPTVTPTVTVRPTEVLAPAIERNGVSISGVPEKIDKGNVVDVAKGSFKNTLGLGTEAFIAEPGGLLVGPDFGSKSAKNPFGENPAGWDAMYGSEGGIRPFSPVSQEVLRYAGPAFQNLPEGGFVLASAGQMTAKVGEVTFNFKAEPGKNYFFMVRGRYADGKQDSDLNGTIEFTNYKPGHALVNMYESRDKTNIAFVSEGQFLQMVGTSHSSGTNCGAEGCSKLTAVFFDVNTKALTVIEQTQGRFDNPAQGWKEVFRNW